MAEIPFKICCAFEESDLPATQEGTSYDEIVSCNARIFEELPGYITVECISNDSMISLIDAPKIFGVSVCLLEKPSEEQIQILEYLLNSQKDQQA